MQHGDRLLMQLDPSALSPAGLSAAAAAPTDVPGGDEQQAYARARVEVGLPLSWIAQSKLLRDWRFNCSTHAGPMQVEGQTPGFKGASRAYRKIGECSAAYLMDVARLPASTPRVISSTHWH